MKCYRDGWHSLLSQGKSFDLQVEMIKRLLTANATEPREQASL